MLAVINTILISIVQVISCTYVVQYLTNKKLVYNARNITILALITLAIYIMMTFNFGMYKPLIFLVILIIGYKFICDLTIDESVVINFISLILHFISEAFIPALIMLFQIPEAVIQKYLQMTPLSGLIIFGFIYILLKLFGKWILKLKNVAIKSKIMTIFYILLSIGLVMLFWRNLINWTEVNLYDFLSNIFIIMLFITTLILLFKGRYDIYKTNNKFDELFEQSESVKSLLNRYKKHNHENKNQLIIIRENSIENEKVVKYIDSILKENVGHEDKWISELSYITDPGISGFLSVKINKMVDNKIKVSLTVSPKVKKYSFKNISSKEYKEICRVLGVYLDNAYEASKSTRKKEVTIEMLLENKELLIIISNSFKGKVELEKIDEEGYTTKGKKHGVGLSLVKDIIKTNKKLEQKREVIQDYFYQYLYIKN